MSYALPHPLIDPEHAALAASPVPFPLQKLRGPAPMHPEELEQIRQTRTNLWARACAHEITVEQLYAALARLRKQAGEELYRIARLGRR